ncbi:MAG: hypothetical protein ABIE36_02705 [Candidatus Diapherotrites archaeon]
MKKRLLFKKGIVMDYLPWIIIAVLVLVIVLISIFFMSEKGNSFIDQIKNLFRRS